MKLCLALIIVVLAVIGWRFDGVVSFQNRDWEIVLALPYFLCLAFASALIVLCLHFLCAAPSRIKAYWIKKRCYRNVIHALYELSSTQETCKTLLTGDTALLGLRGLIALNKDNLNMQHAYLVQAIKLLPASPYLHRKLHACQIRLFEHADSLQGLYDFTAAVPKQERALYQIALYWLYAQHAENPIDWLTKAHYVMPQHFHFLNALIKHHIQDNQTRKAYKLASKNFNLCPHPIILQHILDTQNISDPLKRYQTAASWVSQATPALTFYLGALAREAALEGIAKEYFDKLTGFDDAILKHDLIAPQPFWQCMSCQSLLTDWRPLCAVCGGITIQLRKELAVLTKKALT